MNPPEKITEHIASYGDWRGEMLTQLRQLINEAAPELTEDFKWNVPVWTHNGMVCAISGFKDHVKINFFKGASLPDPGKLFNSGFDSKNHRSINFSQGDELDNVAVADLVRAAVALN